MKQEANLSQKFLLLVIANVLNVVLIYLSIRFIHKMYGTQILLAFIMSGFTLNLSLILGFIANSTIKRSFCYVALLVSFISTFIGDGAYSFRIEWFAIQLVSTLIGIFFLRYKSFLPFKE